MNDTELDEMLDCWKAANPSAALRKSVSGLARPPVRTTYFSGWRARAAVFASIAILLFAGGRTFAQFVAAAPRPLPRFIVDSTYMTYDERGTPTPEMYLTSSAENAQEFVISRSVAGDPLTVAFWKAVDGLRQGLLMVMAPVRGERLKQIQEGRRNTLGFATGPGYYFFHVPAESNQNCHVGPVAAGETILNYGTLAFRAPVIRQQRVTIWLAPELSCIALRVTVEDPIPNGGFRLAAKKEATRIQINRR